MSDVIIDVGKNKTSRINLGIQGENIVEHVIFDISSWVEEYGEGVAFIYAKRRGDDEPYPVALDMDMTEKTATWDVNLTDTAAKGKGSAQLVYVVDENDNEDFMDDEVKKTKTYATTVQASLVVASEENPSGYDTWLEVLGGYTVRVEAAKVAAEAAQTAAEAAQAAAETAQSLAEAAQTAAETAEANAEASEDDAETAATNAATSETNAANSATSAAASASSASTSATNAANSAASASGSASAAQTAATNASQSASAGSGSATDAANSASAAATSETNAKASEDDAEAAASAAATSETNAANSATAAAASATNASQSATAASGSASTASTAATTATTKAGEASTSATNAANSASDASASASAAAASAEAAAQSAASLEVDTELDDTSTNPVQNKVIKAELNDKANVDGYYESLGAGTADQLASNIYEEDSVPYNFRTSGGSIDIGDRETDMIIGGTVAWNQLVVNGNFADTSGWTGPTGTTASGNILTFTAVTGTVGITATTSNFKFPETANNHKYLCTVNVKLTTGTTNVRMRLNGGYKEVYTKSITDWQTLATVYDYAAADNHYIQVQDMRGGNYDAISVANFMVIDLTAMFGSTIADYIYSLEQSSAGAGVAWFKKLFPASYYEYNAGELISVEGLESHDTVGFNQWDEEWELGYWNLGQKVSWLSTICSTNKIPVLPNTSYYFNSPNPFFYTWYDSDGKFLPVSGYDPQGRLSRSTAGVITSPDGAYFMTFNIGSLYGTTYNQDICINLSWDGERDGEYEAYVKHSYPLDSDLTLRGIPKLDASNNLYYDGDTYESDGTVTRNFREVTPSANAWYYSPTSGFTYSLPSGYDTDRISALTIVTGYDRFIGGWASVGDKQFQALAGIVGIKDSSYSTLDEWKSHITNNPVTILFPITPTTETADPYTNPQIVDDFGTEEYVDYAYSQSLRDVSIPVGHYTQYMANLKAKLEMSPNSPDGAGDYIVRQSNGENEYVSLSSNATIQDIIARLEALEGGGE